MTNHLPTYLHTLRKRWAMTERDLAFLLRVSPERLNEIERNECNPPLTAVIGAEIVFGEAPRAVFPAFYDRMETEVMRRASALFDRLENRKDKRSAETRRLLLDMVQRGEPLHNGV